MNRLSLLLLLSLLLVSCATRPQLTRQDWLRMTQHTFKDTTVDEVLETSEQVLRLADPSDVRIYHLPNKMVGSRHYLIYAVIAASFGHYNFDMSARQKGADVITELYIGSSAQAVSPTATMTPGVKGGWQGIGGTATTGPVNIGTPIEDKEAYLLYFMRMESLLYGKPWISCEQAKEKTFPGVPSRALEPLCLLADDNSPNSTPVQQKQAEQR